VLPHFLSLLTQGISISGIPRDVSFNVVQDTFASVEGIVAVHNLRIWGLTTDKTALAAHLVIGKALSIVYLYNPTDWVVQQKIGLILPV
jgi:Co/Zn/Cd efflux system component